MHQVTDSHDELFARFEQLNEIGAALSSERDIGRLLERILVAAKSITGAEAGTLYRVTEDGKALRFSIALNDALGLALGGASGRLADFPDLPLFDAAGEPNHALVAAHAALTGETVNIPDAYSAVGFDFSGTRQFDRRTGYRSQAFLTVPMKNHENEIIGVLQLINPRDAETNAIHAFTPADQHLAESLASQAAIALTNRQLIDQLETLFESFIRLINLAIDEKSPYTGGHCQRVPELAMMLAEAVNRTQSSPLADFTLSPADLHELKIAALLHDCGKVTTPVHVVDKATKLQTLFDRIELIDTRFEVVKRDVQIATLRRLLELRAAQNAEAEAACWESLQRELDELDAERDFLRAVNRGSEAMRPEDQQRVRDIGTQRQWRNPAGVETDFLDGDEIENLTIRSGTLTTREREIINHHIVATIRMLEALPWPKHLKHVPEYAGGHHERMDGRGYPKGLTREQMSLPARLMGIADIFEALTAKDRPYKPAMKLSQALAIMEKFAANGHIDPDLFEVFVREKVWLRYAQTFLAPEQIDLMNWPAV
ncbi:GAF and HD-GYP domain-containing protein [Sulfuricystis multivorans]|uniref:GAF and HD-GYP domain-containing protein n=1 Tax=Sulfuricystis multivorans TaxID=2211108 RepID=UPI001558E149|nr:HD family phosphohydrolase [Sulfuricystis multivorans]